MFNELISRESPLFDIALSGSTQEVGNYFHSLFIKSIENLQHDLNTFYLLTPHKLAAVPLLASTSAERYEEALEAGRNFSTEFGVQPIHFLVHQALCFEGSGHSAASPKDDPNRTEVAYTFVAPLLDLCMTSTLSQYMEIMHGWNLRLWSDEIHEGLSVHARNENSLVVSTINKELGHYNQHEENIFVIDNLLFDNCIVGLSPSFPAIHNLNNRTPLEQAITLTLMSKKADALNNEAYAE